MRAAEVVVRAPLEVICRSRSWAGAVVLCTLTAGLTALAAQVRIPLPFTPVPLTLQVFVVLLSAGLLGSRLGAISQLEYLGIGACGFPVFSGGKGGLAGLAGPTGGYLAGFVICSFAVGWILERRRRSLAGTLAACIVGLALIYLPGWLWLTRWMAAGGTLAARGAAAFSSGILPFLAVDIVKACAAAPVIWAVRRRCA